VLRIILSDGIGFQSSAGLIGFLITLRVVRFIMRPVRTVALLSITVVLLLLSRLMINMLLQLIIILMVPLSCSLLSGPMIDLSGRLVVILVRYFAFVLADIFVVILVRHVSDLLLECGKLHDLIRG
jgi:hypothetical protein